MEGAELKSLAEDIRESGQQEPIKIFQGKVLDGRNRALACAMVGVKTKIAQWHQNGISPLAFVISQNLERRHLSASERAGIGATVLPQLRREARERQRAAGKQGIKGGRGHRRRKPLAKKCAKGSGKASEIAAAQFGVSSRTIEKAVSLSRKQPGILRKLAKGEITLQRADKEINCKGKLHERFVAEPFTVLNASKAYWLERKQAWNASGIGGGHNEQENSSMPSSESFESTSSFDPVLAECVYRWFCPPKGKVLDPCAGEAVKGLVAAKLGLDYTGIELRREQVEANSRRAKRLNLAARWICGDSAKLSEYVPARADFDLVFTSPPYFDTEIYSKAKKDSSAFGEVKEFLVWYQRVFEQAVARLKPNRFLVVKIGEGKRNSEGFFNNLVGESIKCFLGLGLNYYNSAVLATAIGTAAQRVENQFPNYRKLVSTHQTVLCFFKGNQWRRIPEEFGLLGDEHYGKAPSTKKAMTKAAGAS
jgi:DNA modification methylase